MTKVFIDGSAGTTGLKIKNRLEKRKDITLITLKEEERKDLNSRIEAIKSSDISFLCLPDKAATEIAEKTKNFDSVIIDTSTAHRTDKNWTYGFSEIVGKETIRNSRLISNPGCHASGFIALVNPLIKNNVVDKNTLFNCFSITGYSGGGKGMIAEYSENNNKLLNAPRMYALTQEHKHLKEMAYYTKIENPPIFTPIVAPFYSGMEVTVPLFKKDLKISVEELKKLYKQTYNGNIVYFNDNPDENGFMSAAALSEKDSMEISVLGNEERILLVSRYDNLGKGASGAAIQNMNIVLGLNEETGLNI